MAAACQLSPCSRCGGCPSGPCRPWGLRLPQGLLPISRGPLREPRRAEGGRGACSPTWDFQGPELSDVDAGRPGEVIGPRPRRGVLGVGGEQGPAGHHLLAHGCFLAGPWPPQGTPSSSLSEAFPVSLSKASLAPEVLSGVLHDSFRAPVAAQQAAGFMRLLGSWILPKA